MSTGRAVGRTQFNPVEGPERRGDRTRVEISGLWTDSLPRYVRGRVAADAEVAVERRGERTFLIVDE
jgi:hypothetical protein